MAVDGTLWFGIDANIMAFGYFNLAGAPVSTYSEGTSTSNRVFPYTVALDTTNDLWFALGQHEFSGGSYTELVVGSTVSGTVVTGAVEAPSPSNSAITGSGDTVDGNHVEAYGMAVDAANKLLFVMVDGSTDADTGIYEYSYTSAGALTDKGFIATDAPGGLQLPLASYYDASTHRLYVVDAVPPGDVSLFDDATNGVRVYQVDATSGALTGGALLTEDSQFITGGYQDGVITAVVSDNKAGGYVYFTTDSVAQANSNSAADTSTPQDTVWYVSKSGGPATQLGNLPSFTDTGAGRAGGYDGLAYDPNGNGGTGVLYVSDESTGKIVQINLNAAGTAATSSSTYYQAPGGGVDALAFVDGPVIKLTSAPASYIGGGAAEALLPGLTLSDPNAANVTSAVVTVTGGYSGDGDVLSVNGSTGSISYDGKSFTVAYAGAGSASETLTISGAGTAADYQGLLQEVQFSTTTGNPTNGGANPARTVSVQATDAASGVGQSGAVSGPASESFTVSAATPPTLSGFSGTASYALQGGAALTALAATPTISSGGAITGAAIAIANPKSGDVLGLELGGSFTTFNSSPTNETVGGAAFAVSWNSTTDTLSVTGSASAAAYQTLLADVAYQDGGTDTVTTGHPSRTLDWTVSNAAGTSGAAVTTLAIDRSPAVAAHAASVVQGGSAGGPLSDTDADGDSLTVTGVAAPTNATVSSVAGGFTVTPNAGYAGGTLTVYANDSYSYTAPSSGAGAHAGDLSAYATGSHPTDSFSYTVSDGHGGTTTETLTFTIDRAPTVSLSPSSVTYTSGGAAVQLQSAAALADPDGDNLASATVVITGGFSGDGDQLLYGGPGGTALGATTTSENGLSLTYNAAAETLTIAGNASASVYQGVVDNLYFGSTAGDPTNAGANASRTVDVTATDASGATSTAASETVGVAPAAPTLATLANATGTGGAQLTDHAYVELTGTAAANSTVSLYNGSTLLGSGAADGSGHFDITATTALADGNYSLTATAAYGAATSGVSSGFSVTVDTTAPSAAVGSETLGSDTGYSSSDHITSNGAVTLSGTVSDTGSGVAAVEIFSGSTDLGAATVNGTSWSLSTTLGQGSYSPYAKATDLAGNTSSSSPGASIVVDTTAPTLGTAAASPSSGAVHAGGTMSFTVTPSEAVVVSGTPQLTLSNGATASYSGATGGSVSSLTFTYAVAGGQYSDDLQVTGLQLNGGTIQDLAGNSLSGGVSASDTGLEVDTTAPSLALTATSTDAVQGGAPVAALSGATISDTDGPGTLSGGSVGVEGAAAGDVLSVTGLNGGVFDGAITVSGVGTGALTFSGDATTADYQQLLAAVTYQDAGTDTATSGHHATRTLDWSVSNGSLSSGATTSTVTLDRAPQVSNIAATVLSNGSASGDATGGASDPDNASASFTVTQAAAGSAPAAAVASSGSTTVHGTYGDLVISADGTYTYTAGATQAETTALAGVQGQHAADVFTLTVADSDGPATAAETQTFTIDRAPVVSSVAASVSYTEGAAAVTLSPTAAVTDADGDLMTSASVAITSTLPPGVVLAATTSGTSVSASYDAATGVLSLSGADTAAHYQQVLDSVTFSAGTESAATYAPGHASQTISWTVTESPGADSAVVTETVQLALAFADTAANVASELDTLQANVGSLASITITDGQALAITAGQDASDAQALAKIVGAHTLDISGVTGQPYTSASQSYDAGDHLTAETLSGYDASTYGYTTLTEGFDSQGRVTSETYLNGAATVETATIAYGSDGSSVLTATVTGQPYTGLVQDFDPSGHLTRETLSGYAASTYGYTSITDDYDSQGRVTTQTETNGATVVQTQTHTYNSDGSSSETVSGNLGQPYDSYTLNFDAGGQLVSETFSGYDASTFGYDSLTDTFDSQGRVTGQTEFNGGVAVQTANVTYNQDGSSAETVSGVSGQPYTTYTQDFDSKGHLTSETLGGYDASTYGYDSVSDTFDSQGRVTGQTESNGSSVVQTAGVTYNDDGSSVVTMTVTGQPYTGSVQDLDASGHLTSETVSGYDASTYGYTSVSNAYDSQGRITSQTEDDGSTQVGSRSFVYHNDGSFTETVTGVQGEPFASYAQTFSSGGQLLTESLYNTDGSETDDAFANGQSFPALTVAQAQNAIGTGETFVIQPGFSQVTLNGYQPGQDSFDIASSLFPDFSHMMADAKADSAGDTVITYSPSEIFVIIGATPTVLQQHASDFHFV